MEYSDILKNVSLFRGIAQEDLTAMLSCLAARAVSYEKKATIWGEGDKVDKVGIVLSGQVQIVKEDFYGNRNIMAMFGAGELFGETFVCADVAAFPVSVVAVTDCELMFVDFRKLITTCNNACEFHNQLILNMLRILANKNLHMNQKLEMTSKRSTREKLLAYLSSEAKKAKSSSFTIPLNRQELADFLAVDRSAMSAELSKLRDDGVLQFEKNHFTLL